MSGPSIDPERLAALLDGRLDDRQRAEVLAALATSEDALSVHADAAAVAHELDEFVHVPREPRADGEVAPLAGARRIPRRLRSLLLLAAALLLAVVGPWLWLRSRAAVDDTPARLVARLERPPSVGAADLPPAPWQITRGTANASSASGQAVRIGARLFDLQLAVSARDTAAASAAARDVVALLEAIPAAAPVASIYRQVAERSSEPAAVLAPLLAQGWYGVARVAEAEYVRLGAVTEAARAAASRHDTGFFAAAEVRVALSAAAKLPTLSADARAGLERARDAGATGGEPAWRDLELALAVLLRQTGR